MGLSCVFGLTSLVRVSGVAGSYIGDGQHPKIIAIQPGQHLPRGVRR
jgi:hypothetical protein